MKQKKLCFLLAGCLPLCMLCSQQTKNLSFGIEAGSSFVTGEMNENWNVRQDVSNTYYSDSYFYSNYNSVESNMTTGYFGIKPELSFNNNKFAISSGIRYTHIGSDISKNASSRVSFFYLRNGGNATSSEFYKVKSITESNDYIGIPLEFKLTPIRFERFAVYLKAGAELNYKINTDTKIDFANDAMNSYEQEIINSVGVKPNSLYSSFYWSLGMSLGKVNRTRYCLDILLPSFFLTKNNSSLIVPDTYGGFSFSILLPVKEYGSKKSEK